MNWGKYPIIPPLLLLKKDRYVYIDLNTLYMYIFIQQAFIYRIYTLL